LSRECGTGPAIQTPFLTCCAPLAAPNSVLITGDSIATRYLADTIAQFPAASRPACINAQAGGTTAGAVLELTRYCGSGEAATTVIMEMGSRPSRFSRSHLACSKWLAASA